MLPHASSVKWRPPSNTQSVEGLNDGLLSQNPNPFRTKHSVPFLPCSLPTGFIKL